ncbi:MAG: hypothetical protein R3B81_15895 [bacterium]
MPLRIRIENPIVYADFEGETTDAEILTEIHRVWADPALPISFGLLIDVRRSESLGRRSPEKIQSLVSLLIPYVDRFRRRFAVVVAEDVQFGMVRMAAAFADFQHISIEVFRDLDSARAWLDREEP